MNTDDEYFLIDTVIALMTLIALIYAFADGCGS